CLDQHHHQRRDDEVPGIDVCLPVHAWPGYQRECSNGLPRISCQRRMPAQMSCADSANQNSSRSASSITPSATRNSKFTARHQNASPTSTTGNGSILCVCTSVSVSNSSSSVP